MRATIVKLPAKYAVIMGDGEFKQVEFGRSGYVVSEIAKAHGATEIEMGDHKKCLSYTHMPDGS